MSSERTEVAVTGATGFLGVHLVAELLRRHRGVTVLARGEPEVVLGTLRRRLRLVGVPDRPEHRLAERLHVVPIDLTSPGLGLAPPEFRRLASDVDRIWHCAGDITFDGDLDRLREVNVTGTRNVLDLATAGTRHPTVHHISTAAVAGARRQGRIRAEPLEDVGFECTYERSKHEAETVVRRWATDNGRPAVIHRPSGLITDRPHHAPMPLNPLTTLVDVLRRLLDQLGIPRDAAEHRQPVVRIPADRTASVNLLPVEHAAATMTRLAEHQPSRPVETHHVVHQHDVLAGDLLQAMEHSLPVRFRVVTSGPPDPSPLESAVQNFQGVHRYLRHHRRYDSTGVRALLGDAALAPPIDAEYLRNGTRIPEETTTRLP